MQSGFFFALHIGLLKLDIFVYKTSAHNLLDKIFMIKKLLCIILIFSSVVVSAQADLQKKIDSLQLVLQKSNADTTMVKLYNYVANLYTLNRNLPQGLRNNDLALELATKLKWGKGITETYANYAINYANDPEKQKYYFLKALQASKRYNERRAAARIYEYLSTIKGIDFNTAIIYNKKALAEYKVLNNKIKYRAILRNIAGLYSNHAMYCEAADNYMKALTLAEKEKDTIEIIDGYRYLALMYKGKGDDNKALIYYLKLLPVLQKNSGSLSFLGDVHSEIGDLYYNKKDYRQGLYHFKKSLEYFKNSYPLVIAYVKISKVYKATGNMKNSELSINIAIAVNKPEANSITKMINYTTIAEAEYNMYKYNDAISHYQMAFAIGLQFEPLEQQPELLQIISLARANTGVCYFMLAKQDNVNSTSLTKKGINFLEQAVPAFKSLNDFKDTSTYSKQLSNAYELLGDHAKALNSYKDYIKNRDTIISIAKEEQFARRESEYEYGKKESLLKAKQQIAIEKEQANRNYAFAGVGILVLVSGGAGVAYTRKRKDNRIIAREKKRSDDLLLNILPAEVAEELKASGEAHAQQHETVSIIFTDFVGFTKLSEKLTPTELIAELNYCFKAFDNITTKYNIEKIKTIGDSYMAVSGLPTANADHALNAVKAALEIRDFIVAYKEQREQQGKVSFEMRIGINSGEVVAGIVGIKKFAYDIWGDAVNIASRMETNGYPGKVNISETTYNLVKDHYDTEYRGELDAKGKGLIKMYFAESKS